MGYADNLTEAQRQKGTLCWTCSKAVPKADSYGRYIRGCSWSISLKPVEGWDAVPCKKDNLHSYHVISCPLYAQEAREKVDSNTARGRRKMLKEIYDMFKED